MDFMKKRKQQLTPKQEIFIHELLADPAMNAAKSAEKAGYSKKTAKVQGHQLLQKPLIKAAIEQAQEKRIQRLEISADELSQFWAAIAFTPISEFYNEDPDALFGFLGHLAVLSYVFEVYSGQTGGRCPGFRRST